MVNVVSSILTGGTFLLKFFKYIYVNLGLKCKCDVIEKNSNANQIVCFKLKLGGSTPETLAVYSGFFFDDVVLLLNVSS